MLRLHMLSHEEILILLQKLSQIHAMHYQYESSLSDNQLVHFMELAVGRLGADELLTTREIVRDFMDLLNTLHQNSELTFEELLGERHVAPASADPDDVNDFLAEFEL
ncbi:hypothetical protein D3C76_1263370 [compost metagenome]